jgi:hypothetical protein
LMYLGHEGLEREWESKYFMYFALKGFEYDLSFLPSLPALGRSLWAKSSFESLFQFPEVWGFEPAVKERVGWSQTSVGWYPLQEGAQQFGYWRPPAKSSLNDRLVPSLSVRMVYVQEAEINTILLPDLTSRNVFTV